MKIKIYLDVVIMIIIVPILSGVIFIIWLVMFFKMSSTKGLEKRLAERMNMIAKIQNDVIKNNKELYKETADISAEIRKDAIKTMAYAVKEGFEENDDIYCKHCGISIDSDSKFCKSCGRQQ